MRDHSAFFYCMKTISVNQNRIQKINISIGYCSITELDVL